MKLSLLPLLLCSCTTTVSPDGTKTTSFDYQQANQAVQSGLQTYDQYQRIRYPDRPQYYPGVSPSPYRPVYSPATP